MRQGRRGRIARARKASGAGETLHLTQRALPSPTKKIKQTSPQAAPPPSPGGSRSGVPHLIGGTEATRSGSPTETAKPRWRPAGGRRRRTTPPSTPRCTGRHQTLPFPRGHGGRGGEDYNSRQAARRPASGAGREGERGAERVNSGTAHPPRVRWRRRPERLSCERGAR